MLTEAADNDFLFRTALSDKAQGPALARLTRERGFDNVGLIYVNDAYGQGLARAFEDAWEGEIRSVAFERGQPQFASELRDTASRRRAGAGRDRLRDGCGEHRSPSDRRRDIR